MRATQAPPDGDGAEAALVERARGDPAAFAPLYDRYVERIYRHAFRRLGSHAEAEDITAQTFHRALEAIGEYEWRGVPFAAWLFRISSNAISDHYRAKARTAPLNGTAHDLDALATTAPAPEAHVLALEEAASVWDAVRLLPPMQRRAVTLRFARGMSHAEVGAVIGRSESATKQLMYRAMCTLRARLGVTA